jgi:hypothetical protein
MQYSDRFFSGNLIDGRMGQDDVTLNSELPKNDALDGNTRMMVGLRPRNLLRFGDTTCIADIPLMADPENSSVHSKPSPTFIFTKSLLGPLNIFEPEQAAPLTRATRS